MHFLSKFKFSIMTVITSKKMTESFIVVAIVAGSTGYASHSYSIAISMFLVLSAIWLLISTTIFMLSNHGKAMFEANQCATKQ